MESLLKRFSVGYVAVDKERNTPFIRVIPVETIPQLDGFVDELNRDISYKGFTGDGEQIEGKVTFSNAIKAEWIGDSGQRVLAPDVRKGETVTIYRYADSDRYFWKAEGRKRHLRKEETVVLCVGATPADGTDTVLDSTTAYMLTTSGHDGHITLSTSKANGEKCAYVTQFNPKKGIFTWKDDCGQVIQVNSLTNLVVFKNKQGSIIKLDKSNIVQFAPDSITHEAANSYDIKCKDFTVKAENSVNIEAGSSIKMKTKDFSINTDSLKITSQSVNVTATSTTFVCPMSSFSGMVTCGGLSVGAAAMASPMSMTSKSAEPSCKVVGSMSIEGGMNLTEDLTVGGQVIVKGKMTAQTVVSIGPISAPNIP